MLLPRHYVEKPWGRTDLPAIFTGTAGRRIGEVWFDMPDEALPLLVKWLFTSERLSVQVHPNDAQARMVGALRGKEECWFIVAAEPGATVGIGTRRPLSPEELRDTSISGEIEGLIDWKPAKPGDFWFIPAGTVHAIGAGVKLVEIQQNSDMTYRLYDYGRPRELHLAESMSVSKPEPYNDARSGNWLQAAPGQLMACEHFRIFKLAVTNAAALHGSMPVWVTPILGEATVNGARVPAGACAYAPEGLKSFAGEPALLAMAVHG
jgi:mannose-6-phosphate isomerase